MIPFPAAINRAVLCGPRPRLRDWQTLPIERLTTGERVLRFASDHLRFPEGKKVGQPLVLAAFQQAFILAVFDNPNAHTRKAILSVGRRAGKTLVMAVILLAFIVGPLAKQNTIVRSAAMTREQAGFLFRLMMLVLELSPDVEGLYAVVPSVKRVIGYRRNVEYQALSRDAKSNQGQGIYVLVLDEAGQIDAPQDAFLDMLGSSMGSYDDARTFIISTQAPSDQSYLSLEIDAAERDQPPDVVCHLYTAPTDDFELPANWHAANPSLAEGYRSLRDVESAARDAAAIPAKQPGFLNLYLNRRVQMQSAWMAPGIIKANNGPIDRALFTRADVYAGIDLSAKHDLTAAVFSCEDDDGIIHLWTLAFTPAEALESRGARDRIPYVQWVREGNLIAVPGASIALDWVADYLRRFVLEHRINLAGVEFDRWGIAAFKASAERVGFAQGCTWHEVGQGFKDMGQRTDAFMGAALNHRLRIDGHPVMRMALATAVAVSDPAGAVKLDKSRKNQRIDAAVAGLMSTGPLLLRTRAAFDVSALVG